MSTLFSKYRNKINNRLIVNGNQTFKILFIILGIEISARGLLFLYYIFL